MTSISTPAKPGVLIGNSPVTKIIRVNERLPKSGSIRFQSLELKATGGANYPSTKPGSILCSDCDGNGAVLCTQCLGSGVNSKDHFNGQFKAGGLCWLCRGKRDILCGNCNGAGFIGGFMSTFDE